MPELASRAHQQNIIPVVEQALKKAGIQKEQLNAIAFTRGPGLMGSLLVGSSFAKGFALGLNIPLIEVNHMQAHILAHFIQYPDKKMRHPELAEGPFLCLTVSGGHTQIVKVTDHLSFELLGETIDDAVGDRGSAPGDQVVSGLRRVDRSSGAGTAGDVVEIGSRQRIELGQGLRRSV